MFYCQWWSKNNISTLKVHSSQATELPALMALRFRDSRRFGRFSHQLAESDANWSSLQFAQLSMKCISYYKGTASFQILTRLAFAPMKNKMVHKGATDVQLDLAKITSSLLEADDQPWFPECVLAPICKGHWAKERGG